MESHTTDLIPLLLVIGMAFLVPVILKRLNWAFIPVVVGEILAGMLMGKSGLDIIHNGAFLEILSTLGFIFLMFLSGLEISFSGMLRYPGNDRVSPLRRVVGSHLSLSLMTFIGTLGLSLIMAMLLLEFGWAADFWIMGLILSTTSLGIVVPVLKEHGMVESRFGQLMLFCALVADFGSILLISIYVLLLKQGVTAEILLVLLLFAVFAGVYRLATLFQRHLPAERFFDEMSSATSQIRLRGALALALVFAVLAGSLGVETILGAFLAGVIVSMLIGDSSSALREKLDAVGYGFLIPIFFITVGADVNLPALMASRSTLAMLPVLLAMAFAVKMIPAGVFAPFYSWRQTLAGGGLLSARLSLIIAVAMIGRELGVVTEALNSAVVLLAVVTCTISPMIFRWMVPPQSERRKSVIVMGCRNMADMLGRRLRDQNRNTVSVCMDGNDRKQKVPDGAPSFRGRDTVVRELKDAGAARARILIALEEKDEDNLLICRTARLMFGVKHLISWVQDPAYEKTFRRLGVRIVNPARATLFLIEAMAINSDVFEMAEEMDASVSVREVKLKKSPLVGRRVEDVPWTEAVTVIGIVRGGDQMVPDNRTRIQANDTLTLIGSRSELERVLERIRNDGK